MDWQKALHNCFNCWRKCIQKEIYLLPNRNYEATKILCLLGMEYKKIHSCLNNCILYRNEFEDLRRCSMCDLSRYKVKVGQKEYNDEVTKEGPLAKVVWYLSIISRLKCLFATTYDAKIHRWHVDDRKIDGLRRLIYKEFLEFVKESRNLRLGLVTNGMNPFGNLSSNHSSWPVLLVI